MASSQDSRCGVDIIAVRALCHRLHRHSENAANLRVHTQTNTQQPHFQFDIVGLIESVML